MTFPALVVETAEVPACAATVTTFYRTWKVSVPRIGAPLRLTVLADAVVVELAPAVPVERAGASFERAKAGMISHVDSNPVGHAPGLLPAGAGVYHNYSGTPQRPDATTPECTKSPI